MTEKKKGAFAENLKESLRSLKTLTAMQLREKKILGNKQSARKTLFKYIYFLIEFAAITAILTLIFHFVKLLGIFSLVHDIPVSVISLIFFVMLVFSVVTDTVGLMKALYFSKDNTVLLTFPASPSTVFLSKLAVYYVYEFKKNFMFTIPLFIAFGIAKSFSFLYYPWLLLLFGFITAVPVLLAALLSIPSMFVYLFINRVKFLQYLLYAAVGSTIILALWYAIGLIPENINLVETWGTTYWEIQDFLKGFTTAFAPIHAFTELIVGKTVGLTNVIFHSETILYVLILIGITVLLFALCFLFSKPLFYKMASTPFEFKKKNSIKEKKNKITSPFLSGIRKEWISGIRSNSLLKLASIQLFILPLTVELLNKLYSAMNTRFLGMQMTVCFNAIIMMLILLTTNIDIASTYSRDGSSAYLNKVQPTAYWKLLFSKLFFPLITGALGTAIATFTFSRYSSLSTLEDFMLGMTVYLIYVTHIFWSAEMDIMNPQYAQYATFNSQANNPNENLSGVLALILSVIFFVTGLLFSMNGEGHVWLRLAGLAGVFALAKIFTFFVKVKIFYKEKQ